MGYQGGIYRPPIFGMQFSRNLVTDPGHGVPFMTGSAMLQADTSWLPLVANKLAMSKKFASLRLAPGMTLISCSGTIGRAVYSRPDMDGVWSSQDIMKIVPDSALVPPGYLFAYLTSRFGVSLITQGTYGGVVQHIEREHLLKLLVPRLGQRIELAVHELVDDAAKLRAVAVASQRRALARVHALVGWTTMPASNIAQAAASGLRRRMDAFHHSPRVVVAREALQRQGAVRLGDKVETVFEPNRGPRFKVEDASFGVPFLSSSEVFRLDPVGEYSISRRRTPHLDRLLVSERDLLLPRSGQLGGIIGRGVLPLPTYYGHAASEHLVRIRCRSKEDACFLWSVFASEPGYLATIGTAFGSSIPSLDCDLIADMKVPWFDGAVRSELSDLVASAVDANTRAIRSERKAVQIVEDTINKSVN